VSTKWSQRLAWASLIFGLAALAYSLVTIYWMATGDLEVTPFRVFELIVFRLGLVLVLLWNARTFFRWPRVEG